MGFDTDRKVLVPIAAYAFFAICAVILIDTVARVYVHGLLCLAIAFLVPALLSAQLPNLVSRLAVSSVAALIGVLLFDGTGWMVIVKAEPFGMLRSGEVAAWLAYAFGFCLFVPLSFGVAWVAAPLRGDIPPALRRWFFADAQ